MQKDAYSIFIFYNPRKRKKDERRKTRNESIELATGL